MGNAKETERKVNAIVDEILDEDTEEPCPRGCNQSDNTAAEASSPQEVDRRCKCAVENSWRFSLRVMEAMRSLQRDPDQPSTSSAEDIVDYIRSNYRSDGDLYAQVRTALRQVCSQGFVVELFKNEYHLIGPVASSTSPNGCSFDRDFRTPSSTTTDDTPRRRRDVNDRETDAECRCKHFPGRNGPYQSPRSPREHALEKTNSTIGHLEDLSMEDILHSTRKSVNNDRNDYRNANSDIVKESPFACSCQDISVVRNERHRRQRDDTERIHHATPIAGPSRMPPRATLPTPAKKDREETYLQRRDEENDKETTTEEEEEEEEEEDLDCTCDTVAKAQKPQAKKRPRDRTGNQRSKRRRKKVQEDEDEEEEVVAREEDEDANDSVYRRLKRQDRRRRSATRERELKRWIRRCREECERRKAR